MYIDDILGGQTIDMKRTKTKKFIDEHNQLYFLTSPVSIVSA